LQLRKEKTGGKSFFVVFAKFLLCLCLSLFFSNVLSSLAIKTFLNYVLINGTMGHCAAEKNEKIK